MKYIVSVGNQHDMAVNVWNWKTKTKLASGKIATKVNIVDDLIPECGKTMGLAKP